jgi:hypothetical protein
MFFYACRSHHGASATVVFAGRQAECISVEEDQTARTQNQYFADFVELTVSVDKALVSFATHPETVLGWLGRYCEESGLERKQAA